MTWKRALVTGASSGIGWEIVHQLAASGTDLVVVARDETRLREHAEHLSVDVEVLVADLTNAADVSRVEDRLRANDAPIDLLVNNAGLGYEGPFIDIALENELATIEVNVVAVVRLAHAAGNAMAGRGAGTILNISSVADSLVGKDGITYAATKHFVTTFSEGLHHQLRSRGVNVTVACPGLTRSDFHRRAQADTSGMPDFLWQEADAVAREALAGAADGRARVVTGRLNKVASAVLGKVPRPLWRKL